MSFRFNNPFLKSAGTAAFLWLAVSSGLRAFGADETPRHPWDMAKLSQPPVCHPAPGFKAEGVRALFYEGLPYKGKPTRVFAWYGTPAGKPGRKVPAVVLVHGGGGTAFDEWVRVWNRRGYAAIAMDLEGRVPGEKGRGRTGHEWSGPARAGIFADIDLPTEDQWMYHAVADVILAHSLVRSFPEVDPERTGLTGISWGGIITCNVVGVDGRFKFAAPVYGCGFLMDAANQYQKSYAAMSADAQKRCRALWDGSSHLPRATMPMLWVNGTNDGHFPLSVFQKSYLAATGPRSLCVRIAMPHGHAPGWAPKEIYAFADSVVGEGEPLVKITGQGRGGASVWVTFKSPAPVVRAELNFTCDAGEWPKRKWETKEAGLDAGRGRASAEMPAGVTAWFFNLTDRRNLVVSSEHAEVERANP